MADFFLLPNLKRVVFDYIFDRLVVTLCFLHAFEASIRESSFKDYHHLEGLRVDLPSAVEKVYECPAARELQKLFAIFACGLREHLPDGTRQDLNKRSPAFHQDVSFVLTILHFPQATNEPMVTAALEGLYVRLPERGNTPWSNGTSTCPICPIPVAQGGGNIVCATWGTVLDPFSSGTKGWNPVCAFQGMKLRLQGILKAWP